MAIIQTNESGFIVKDYKYQRYPLVMHRGEHPEIQSIHVNSEQEEKAAAAKGFSLIRPTVPEPVPEKAALTLEERLEEIEERIAVLEERLAGQGGEPTLLAVDETGDAEEVTDEAEGEDADDSSDTPKRRRGRPRKVNVDV